MFTAGLRLMALGVLAFIPARPAHAVDWDGRGTGDAVRFIEIAAPASAPKARLPMTSADYLSGTASLGCSGAVVRFSEDLDRPAIVLTNGHCVDEMAAGTFAANQPMDETIRLLTRGDNRFDYAARRLIYATMTGTDIALIELDATYRQLAQKGIAVREIAPAPAQPGQPVVRASGYFRTVQSCSVEAIVPKLRESGKWEWRDAYRLKDCRLARGTSGSPLIVPESDKIVGIVNSANLNGDDCPSDACEVDAQGRVSAHARAGYAQRVDQILTCVDARGVFDLSLDSCRLFRGGNKTGPENVR